MTPEQMQADLILDGWRPAQYERSTGTMWRGLWRDTVGLVYYQDREVKLALGWGCGEQYKSTGYSSQITLHDFFCRWPDIMPVLPPLYQRIQELGL